MSENNPLAAMFAAQQGSVGHERMRATMDAYLESWRRNDPEARVKLFTDAPVVEDPVGTPAYRGLAAVRRFWTLAERPDGGFNATLHKFIACGNEAMAHFTIRVAGAGRPAMSIEVHETLKFADDGRISELRAYWNQGNLTIDS